MSKTYWPTRPGVRSRHWDFPKDEEGKLVADAIELEDVADLHDPNSYYDFNTVLVVRSPDGKVWAAHDSGCSCPTPFESHVFPTDFAQIKTVDDFRSFVKSESTAKYSQAERDRAEEAVRKALQIDAIREWMRT